METSRLEIGCAAIKYLVPARASSAPAGEGSARCALLPANCRRRWLAPSTSWFSDSDPSVWIIQQLNIEAAVNVAGEPEQISRALGAQIARCLSAVLQEGNQDNVRHFRNRAEYLASFLSDLASGSAWNQWYYESFGGLKPLPVPAALRTAVCNDVATGKMALSLLSAVELQQVLNELTPQDARRILERFAEDETAVEEAALPGSGGRSDGGKSGWFDQAGG